MADFSEQQLADITQAVARDLREFGQVTSYTADRVRDASVGIEGFSRTVRTSTQQFGRALEDFASSTYRSGGALDQYTNSVRMAGEGMAGLLSMFGPLGLAAAGLTKAFTTLYGVTMKQVQGQYDSFKKLNQSGLFLGAELNDLTQSAAQFGMNIANDQHHRAFVDALTKNSKTLAQFGGGTDKGRRGLEALASAMAEQRTGLMALGFGYDEILEGQLNYIRLQTEAGNKVTGSADQQAKAASNYLRELRALAEITGASVKEQQEAREELLRNQAFQAKIDELRSQGRDKEADNLVATFEILNRQSKEAGKGFADIATGNLRTQEAQKLQLSTQGQAFQAAQRLADGTATVGQAVNQIAQGADAQAKNIRGYVKATGNEAGTFINYVEMKRLGVLKDRDLDEEIRVARGKELAVRANMVEDNKKLLDKINQLPEGSKERIAAEEQLRKNQENLRRSIETENKERENAITAAQQIDNFAAAATKATKALSEFAGVLLKITGALQRLLGFSGNAPAAAAGTQTGGTRNAQGGVDFRRMGTEAVPPAAPGATNKERLDAAPPAAPGATNKERLDAAIKDLQAKFPGTRITSTSGGKHVPGSAHYQNRAMDIGLAGVPEDQKQALMNYLKSNPQFAKVGDESKRPKGKDSQYWSGPHIHAELAKQQLPNLQTPSFQAELGMNQVQAMTPKAEKESKMSEPSWMTKIGDNLVGSKEILTVLQDILNANKNQQDILGKILQNARS